MKEENSIGRISANLQKESCIDGKQRNEAGILEQRLLFARRKRDVNPVLQAQRRQKQGDQKQNFSNACSRLGRRSNSLFLATRHRHSGPSRANLQYRRARGATLGLGSQNGSRGRRSSSSRATRLLDGGNAAALAGTLADAAARAGFLDARLDSRGAATAA